jgi:D-xylose 1-dehydrogenase (NADP+, D-xylono-1,5-lactone-forming)
MNFGIMGVASISSKVAKAIKESKNKIRAIASRDLNKAKNFSTEFEIPKYYQSYEEILSDPLIDAVYIPLPTNLCYEWVEKTAKAKKHIL